MEKYKLSEQYTLRRMDKALFNFSTAQLIQFNDKGFYILLSVLDGEKMFSEKEITFLERIVDAGYIKKC